MRHLRTLIPIRFPGSAPCVLRPPLMQVQTPKQMIQIISKPKKGFFGK